MWIINLIKNYVEYEKILTDLKCITTDNKKIIKCVKKAKRKDRKDLCKIAQYMATDGYETESILNHINYLKNIF